MRLPGSLAPLREQRFAWYFAGRVISTTGTTMAPVALAFAVLHTLGSTSALGLVLAARTVSMLVFLLFGGVVSDRFDRALVMRVSHLLSFATQATVAALVLTGTASLWSLMALEAANGVVSAFTLPAMSSIVARLVPRSQLQQANALLSFTRTGLSIIGPTVAGLLVATAGPGWALAFDALTWLGAALCLCQVVLPRTEEAAGEGTGMWQELREGWAVLTGNTWLWVVVVAFGFLNAIHAGAWFTLGPAVADATFGARGWGLVLSAESAGLVLTTLVLLKVRLERPLLTGMLGCTLFAIPLTLLGLTPHVPVLVMAAFVAGAGMEVFGMGWNLAMQENVDDRMLSRAYSYDALGSYVAMPVGQVVFGPLGDAFGYRDVLVASGLAYAAVALLTLTARSVRTLPRRPVDVQQEAAPA